jgi:hypothetical protein
MWREPRPAATTPIKLPKFTGQEDVEYFIEQFHAISIVNEWNELIQRLQLREALTGAAQDCGKGNTVADILVNLRTRYSLTPKEARSQLNGFKRNTQQTLHEHAAEIQRLISLAYQDLPEENRNTLALESFHNTLGQPTLQRHLLAMRPSTLTEAVQAGNEFLQIKQASQSPRPNIHAFNDNMEDSTHAPMLERGMTAQVMLELTKQLQLLQQSLAALQQTRQANDAKPAGCWGCGATDHLRRNCPTSPWKTTPNSNPTQQTGNEQGPRQ